MALRGKNRKIAKSVGRNGILNCDNMYVLFGEIDDEKQELKTGKCRLARRERGRSSEQA